MRRSLLLLILCALAFAPVATAQDIVWRVAPEPIEDIPAYLQSQALSRNAEAPSASLTARGSEPDDMVFVPSYQVDTLSASGETTLFAVKNTSPSTQSIDILYFDRSLNGLTTDTRSLAPRELITVNLRDIPEVTAAAEADGVARGFVRIEASQEILEGDFFQVNPGQNFATGERLPAVSDYCELWGIRFLNGGAFTGGTDYRFLINLPQGGDPNVDEPSLITNVYTESGALLATVFGYTDLFIVEDTAANIVGSLATSGSLEIFINDVTTLGGLAMGNFSATGRFSVGLDGVCLPSGP